MSMDSYYSMPKAIKASWLRNLRSGKIPQARGAMCRTVNGEDAFCCIGVLVRSLPVDLYWVPGVVIDQKWHLVDADDHQLGLGSIDDALLNQFGIDIPQSVLITKNDTLKHPFRQIADWIDENVRGV